MCIPTTASSPPHYWHYFVIHVEELGTHLILLWPPCPHLFQLLFLSWHSHDENRFSESGSQCVDEGTGRLIQGVRDFRISQALQVTHGWDNGAAWIEEGQLVGFAYVELGGWYWVRSVVSKEEVLARIQKWEARRIFSGKGEVISGIISVLIAKNVASQFQSSRGGGGKVDLDTFISVAGSGCVTVQNLIDTDNILGSALRSNK